MDRGLYIDGAWVQAQDGRRYSVDDPATGEHVGSTAIAAAADVDRAVRAAAKAQAGWANTHADERARIIHRAADLIEARIDAIAELLTREQGKPIPDAKKETAFGVEVLRYYAEEGRRLDGSLRPSVRADIRNVVISAPVGVAAAIVPWNYPVDLYTWKIGPALAAGCAVVAKPPHNTPLAIGTLVECFAEAGLPPGVLNDLPGTGPEAGQPLIEHPLVRIVAATSSTAVGRAIMHAAARDMKRVSLELGGQTPFIVLDDADIAEAAAGAARRSFSNMGQICIAVNRILVDQKVHKAFVEALVEETRKIKLGHGVKPGVLYGPVLNESVRTRVSNHIADAVAKGGKLLIGGKAPKGADYDRGFFFEPALVDNAAIDSLPMTEETYGPLAAIRSVKDANEALALANAVPYGLSAYVFGRDLERAWAFAEKLESGAVGVNVNDTSDLQAPFGGWKLSGLGRELGREGILAYREQKHIKIRLRPLA
ncbi:MAG TPA: aldehyde dehydrogenase family protein [Magnetospirillaceae bacterium]